MSSRPAVIDVARLGEPYPAPLRRAIERHRAGTPEERPPVLKRRSPDPHGSLLLRVDLGRSHETIRLLVIVQPHHTFADLADVLIEALFEDPGHLAAFWVHPEGRSTQNFWDQGPVSAPHWWNGIEVVMEAWDGYCCEHRPPERPTLDGDKQPVVSVLGVGWFAWLRFDYGDEWWLGIRAIAPVPPQAPRGQPEIIDHPLREITQYPTEA